MSLNNYTSDLDLLRFTAQTMGMGTQNVSPELSVELLQGAGWRLLPEERYNLLLRCIRAYPDDLRGHQGNSPWDEGSMWIPHDDLTPNFLKLEEILLEESRRLLFDLSNCCLVLDDELISSRAKDVQVSGIHFVQDLRII